MAEKLSVVIPYVNEYPQNVFTVGALHEELKNVDHEIIVINNTGTDKAEAYFQEAAKGQPWLKPISYDKKLSCWGARSAGIRASTGDILFFSDAHCIIGSGSLTGMLDYYRKYNHVLNGSIHLPLTYQILEWRKLIYKLQAEPKNGIVHYAFSAFKPYVDVYEVPCMSSCGMMVSRDIANKVGLYPEELGIYGGGEHFFNYVFSVMGFKKWIYPDGVLRHFGEKRGYSWNYGDYHRNRMIATYCFGGELWLNRYANHMRSKIQNIDKVVENVINTNIEHRKRIESQQVISIDDWLKVNVYQ